MADTTTTHLNLIKQDPDSRPDYEKDHSNLDKLDDEVWARGKAFNGQAVGADGGFHVRTIPYAENLETSSSQSSDENYIIRTTGGDASLTDGDAWLTLIKGTRKHTGYVPQSIQMTVTPMARPVPAAITATLNEETFIAYVQEAGTYTITYTTEWSTSPATYGITVTNEPVNGDSITVVWDGESDPEMTVNAVERQAPDTISATIDDSVFVAYVTQSGTTTLTYSTNWSADPTLYGITVTGTPIAGDVITVVYVKEVRGTITQSNPETFVSTGWNLYNHALGYARVIVYSETYNFKISGTYTALEFATTTTGTRTTITPVSGAFSIPGDGYLFVTGGNATDTVIWMTWSDWGNGYNWTGTEQGDFAAYTEDEIDFSSFMSTNFPYGLMQVGTVQDEINLNIGIATSRVVRQAYNATNLANAKASGRQYEYDENYIYIERETPVTYTVEIDGDYMAYDHGLEYFTGTEQDVYAQTLYGANLKNKLERDTLTISQQTLTSAQQMQVRSNINAASKEEVKPITIALTNVTNANGNYSNTTSNSNVSEDMTPVGIEVGTPETFLAPITITTGSGVVTLSCPNAKGSSTVTVTLIRTQPVDQSASYPSVTSTEFDILAGRIGTLSSLTTSAKTSAVAAINELKSKLSYNMGTLTVSAFESALKTLGDSMSNSDLIAIRVIISAASGLFEATSYAGFVVRTVSERYEVLLLRNNDVITLRGVYGSSGWIWDELALKSKLSMYFTTLADFKTAVSNLPSSQSMIFTANATVSQSITGYSGVCDGVIVKYGSGGADIIWTTNGGTYIGSTRYAISAETFTINSVNSNIAMKDVYLEQESAVSHNFTVANNSSNILFMDGNASTRQYAAFVYKASGNITVKPFFENSNFTVTVNGNTLTIASADGTTTFNVYARIINIRGATIS